MKSKVKMVSVVLCFAMVLTSCTTSPYHKYSLEEKVEDFNYLYEVIEKEYPLFGVKSR